MRRGSLLLLLRGLNTFHSSLLKRGFPRRLLRSLLLSGVNGYLVGAPVQIVQLLLRHLSLGELDAGQLGKECLALLAGGAQLVDVPNADLLTRDELLHDSGLLLRRLQLHALLGKKGRGCVQNRRAGVLCPRDLRLSLGLLDLCRGGGGYLGFIISVLVLHVNGGAGAGSPCGAKFTGVVGHQIRHAAHPAGNGANETVIQGVLELLLLGSRIRFPGAQIGIDKRVLNGASDDFFRALTDSGHKPSCDTTKDFSASLSLCQLLGKILDAVFNYAVHATGTGAPHHLLRQSQAKQFLSDVFLRGLSRAIQKLLIHIRALLPSFLRCPTKSTDDKRSHTGSSAGDQSRNGVQSGLPHGNSGIHHGISNRTESFLCARCRLCALFSEPVRRPVNPIGGAVLCLPLLDFLGHPVNALLDGLAHSRGNGLSVAQDSGLQRLLHPRDLTPIMVGVLEGIVYETYRVGVLASASCHNRGQGVVHPVTKRLLSCLSPNGLHLRVQLIHGVRVQVDSRLLPQLRQAGQLPLLIGGVAGGHLSLRSHSLLRDDSLRRRGTSPRLPADIRGNLRRLRQAGLGAGVLLRGGPILLHSCLSCLLLRLRNLGLAAGRIRVILNLLARAYRNKVPAGLFPLTIRHTYPP